MKKTSRLAGAAFILAVIAAACAPTPTGTTVNFKFDNAGLGAPASTTNSGTGTVTSALVGTGAVTTVQSIPGQGSRADFPNVGSSFALVKVDNDPAAGVDYLNPGAQDFEFGADVNLDSANTGTNDNGNNVIQRGRADANTSQYKLEIDANGVAKCAVRDSLTAPSATVIATTPVNTVNAGTDFKIRCERVSNTVTIKVTNLSTNATNTWDQTGTIGALDFTPSAGTNNFEPSLSVGGKLNNNGTIAGSADQFNGTIDNAVLIIG